MTVEKRNCFSANLGQILLRHATDDRFESSYVIPGIRIGLEPVKQASYPAYTFTFSVRLKLVVSADKARIRPGRSRLAALVSLSLWTTVAIGGRWIGVP